MAEILIVDDDPQLRKSFNKILEKEGYTVQTAASGEQGIEAVKESPPELVIMDIQMPNMSGLDAYEIMHKMHPKLPVIIMTAFGSTETAIDAIKRGAFDYILKPFDLPDILNLIAKALQAGKFMGSTVTMDAMPETVIEDALVGRSHAMQTIYKAIGRAAPTDATVLIRGETGTGKELVARAVYQHSQRKDDPFLVINCVAIPETLLESELFGYEKGAFTGAVTRKIGKIEQVDRGTIFLDEIGDMPSSIQAKILRLLQEKSIERLGGKKPISVDVRIIAATNRNLEKAVSEGNFREDLYYRLNVVTLTLPPLSERGLDILLLADYFLKRVSKKMNRANPGLDEDAKKILCSYGWPGNVRELFNVVQKALIFNKGGILSGNDIKDALIRKTSIDEENKEPIEDFEIILSKWLSGRLAGSYDNNIYKNLMDYFASILIKETLNFTNGNRTHAAKILGLSRPTLFAKIDKYGIKTKNIAH